MEMEENNSSEGFSPQERARIVLGFEVWLDQYLDRAMAMSRRRKD